MEKATPATVFGRVFDDKDTSNASSKPSSSSSMVFDASKKQPRTTSRMKRKPATKSYKNFTKKKPPSRGERFPAFNVAAAVAEKAQIEAKSARNRVRVLGRNQPESTGFLLRTLLLLLLTQVGVSRRKK